jgi:hypothetical protein
MGRVEGLRDSQALRMRLKSIRSTWVDIAQSYQDYVVKVCGPFHGMIPLRTLVEKTFQVQYLCEFASLSRDGGGSKSQSRSSNQQQQQHQQQQQRLSQDIFNQGHPQMYATCWIAAEHALQHIERYRLQIETTFEHYNIRRSQYAVYAGFDESCIRRGSGYLEQIHIFTLSTILATSPLLTELGKILSPFSSIIFTESSRFSLPVYKDDGTIWEFDELVFKMASKYLDHGSTAPMRPTVISLSETGNNKADESQQDSGDGNGENDEKKDSRGSEEKRKRQNRDNGNGGENPGDPSRDGNHGSGHPGNSGDRDIDGGPDDPDPGETKETTNSPNIAFEVVSNIYTNGNLSQIFQQLNTAGELTIRVRSHTLTIFKFWI